LLDGVDGSNETQIRESLIGAGEALLEQLKDSEGCGNLFDEKAAEFLEKDIALLKSTSFSVESLMRFSIDYTVVVTTDSQYEEAGYSSPPDMGRRLNAPVKITDKLKKPVFKLNGVDLSKEIHGFTNEIKALKKKNSNRGGMERRLEQIPTEDDSLMTAFDADDKDPYKISAYNSKFFNSLGMSSGATYNMTTALLQIPAKKNEISLIAMRYGHIFSLIHVLSTP
jgi:hypothetical protein